MRCIAHAEMVAHVGHVAIAAHAQIRAVEAVLSSASAHLSVVPRAVMRRELAQRLLEAVAGFLRAPAQRRTIADVWIEFALTVHLEKRHSSSAAQRKQTRMK